MNGTNVRTYEAYCARTNERMARSLYLSLSCSLVRLRAFKLDRVQVRPMADVAKLPCDSGFTLSRSSSLSHFLPFLSRFPSVRNGSTNEKNREIERVTGVACTCCISDFHHTTGQISMTDPLLPFISVFRKRREMD